MVSSIWFVASLSIYIFSAEYRKEEFYRRLESKATTAARLLIEFEEVDADLLKKIESANPIQLPSEKISIFDYNNTEIFSTNIDPDIAISKDIMDQIRLEGQIDWQQGDIEVLGLLYTDRYERFVVIAAANDIFGKSKLQNLRNILIIVFLLSILIVALVGRIYARSALQPISNVIAEVNTISATNLDKRISEGNSQDEIALLGITFNRMLDRIQNAFRSQRSFISNASHELRTPMTAILSQIDVSLLKEREKQDYIKTLISVRDDVRNLNELTTKLLLLARTEAFSESFSTLRVDTIIWQLISEVAQHHPHYKIKVALSPDIDDEQQLTVAGNEQMLKSVFLNIIDNACKFSADNEVIISIAPSDKYIGIEFKDQGIGIPDSELEKITQPFFRASNAVTIRGHGIGLSLAKNIIDIHSGSMTITSTEGEGATITVKLETV
ncbi:Two component system histidine kinase [Fulvivirga imtechensis AK7]|uniref:histidine kinase n=2 Tax=Fulvivirga TaxID=396811 RepID=L8JWG7_9BACT|nr:Two component system histidine kinase [Fulvivirga imtechensis AK7]